jgi:hypothetical protein
LFTRPVDIEIQIATGLRWSKTITKFKFEPPGLNVNALTSSSTVYRACDFFSEFSLPKLLED